ncbi:MAG: LysM peptidoglycan-binding domain-containing protein [bacterium]|nr:LysM peptidoglycan-binding domain-containing protein [bacterium]
MTTDVVRNNPEPVTESVNEQPLESDVGKLAEAPAEETTPQPVQTIEEAPSEWSLRDRALAFKPELQLLQETYDFAIHHLASGDLLSAQESIDIADLTLAEALADSNLAAGGMTRLYLTSLQARLDNFQQILDEESMMLFSAPLEVPNDSLIALWYGGLPDIPSRPLELVENDRTQKWIKYFTGKGRKNFQRWLNRGEAYRPLIESYLKKYDLPQEIYYLGMIESGFNLKARSSAGAVGPWQFIRGTGRRYGLAIDYWVDERRDIVKSTEAACLYLSRLYGIFQDWNLAMAGYNSGEFRVQSAARRAGSRNFWDLKLPRETQDYVPKMMAAAMIGRDPGKYGFKISPQKEFIYKDLKVKSALDLSLLAKKGKMKRSTLEAMNPHLLRWCTPPDKPEGYAVYVPPNKHERINSALKQLSNAERTTFARHKVRKGETLYEIAKGYGTTVRAIMRRNGIQNARRLRVGAQLVIPTHPGRSFQQPTPNGVIASAEKALPHLDVPANYAKGYYTVRKGDNLSIIARRLSTSVNRLQRWNGLGRGTRIYPNQVLHYLYTSPGAPGSSTQVADAGSNVRRVHVVKKGDSLYSIGKKYGANLQTIFSWNSHLNKKSVIHPGDKIVVFTNS